MSNVIMCDSCKALVHDDSTAKDAGYHEIWVDRCRLYHVCRGCYDAMMRNIFHMRYDEDEQQYVEED